MVSYYARAVSYTHLDVYKRQDETGLPILGTPADAIDEAEDRERFDELLNISGVGEKKAARYGNAFLRVIEDAVGSRE